MTHVLVPPFLLALLSPPGCPAWPCPPCLAASVTPGRLPPLALDRGRGGDGSTYDFVDPAPVGRVERHAQPHTEADEALPGHVEGALLLQVGVSLCDPVPGGGAAGVRVCWHLSALSLFMKA